MKGKHKIIVQNRSLHYEFEIKRNITIIRGDSATGKTTLIDMIRAHDNLGENSGINLSCDVPCRILEGRNWQEILTSARGTIFFTDEENDFLHKKEFSEAIRYTDNYYVLITRENLYELPYSVDEIYGIRASGKYMTTDRVFQELYKIYSDTKELPIKPRYVITEDSNAGYEFFSYICDKNDIKCTSAGGNSKISGMLKNGEWPDGTFVIADGAAFGSYMDGVINIAKQKGNIHLYLPESFEWLILRSGIVDGKRVESIIDNPENYIDSEECYSWEQFFTDLLISETRDSYLKYSKDKINRAYLHDATASRILGQIRGITGLDPATA